MPRKSNKGSEQPVFYIEKPLKKGPGRPPKKYEPDDDKPTRSRKTTPKDTAATAGVGQKRRSPDHPSEQGAPPPQDKTDTTAGRTETPQTHAPPSDKHDPAQESQVNGDSQGKAPEPHQQGSDKEAGQQGGASDGQGQTGGKEHEEGEGRQAPVLDERAQKLEAARQRATEVRKEKAAARRAAKDAERQAQEHTVRENKQKQEKLAKVFPPAPSSGKEIPPPVAPVDNGIIPAPLPQKPPPKYLSGGEQPPHLDVKTVKDTAFPVPETETLPPLKRSKRSEDKKTEPETGEAAPTARAMDVDEDDDDGLERYLKKKRRELEKKRLLREEMELDRAFEQQMNNKAVLTGPAAPPAPAPAPRPRPRHDPPAFQEDPYYRQQMAQLKRAMLMESIFGSR